MITKFEELIAQMVKNAFQNYSHKVFENCKHERHDFSKGMRNVANNDPEYQEVLDIMANGIHLPPCRKKPPRNFQPFSDHPLDHDLPKTHSLPAKPQNSNKSKREKNKKVDKSLNNPIPTENRGNLII
ncbi:hypothetical protein RF11_10769 [Thelohanellus kitauei]|uniref:Uncharacterized protein n=1 Tax=Thelohanellus kitauei TaxID=669202 RepID=A0A0C2J7D7_THEKT|nr:hypothetical protein RF11_10769 [Thelohanellus kitauei]